MDLSYPPEVRMAVEQVEQAMADLERAVPRATGADATPFWQSGDGAAASPLAPGAARSALGHLASLRVFGRFAGPLAEALACTGYAYLHPPANLATTALTRATALGWPDARAPLASAAEARVEVDAGNQAAGTVQVAPFCVPCAQVVFLARRGETAVLASVGTGAGAVEQRGDGFTLRFEGEPVAVLAEGPTALGAWESLAEQERLGLVGMALGVIDRSRALGLEALCAGSRGGEMLASEQSAQFLVADNDIDQFAAVTLGLDVAVDAEHERLSPEKLALARYATASAAERCAQRARHLVDLFCPEQGAVARVLTERARQLTVFGVAREHDVRRAAAGVVDGMPLE